MRIGKHITALIEVLTLGILTTASSSEEYREKLNKNEEELNRMREELKKVEEELLQIKYPPNIQVGACCTLVVKEHLKNMLYIGRDAFEFWDKSTVIGMTFKSEHEPVDTFGEKLNVFDVRLPNSWLATILSRCGQKIDISSTFLKKINL